MFPRAPQPLVDPDKACSWTQLNRPLSPRRVSWDGPVCDSPLTPTSHPLAIWPSRDRHVQCIGPSRVSRTWSRNFPGRISCIRDQRVPSRALKYCNLWHADPSRCLRGGPVSLSFLLSSAYKYENVPGIPVNNSPPCRSFLFACLLIIFLFLLSFPAPSSTSYPFGPSTILEPCVFQRQLTPALPTLLDLARVSFSLRAISYNRAKSPIL